MRHAAVRVPFRSLLVQRDQWDTSWAAKKLIFLIRDIDDAAMAGASVESCRFVVLRSPRGRLGLVVDMGSRLRRMRRRLGLSRELWIEIFGKSWSRAIERKGPCLYVCTDGSRRACGVGVCARLVATLSDLRKTSGPRIDRIPPTRPPWRRRQYRELKKLIFLAPSMCPIDLFGP